MSKSNSTILKLQLLSLLGGTILLILAWFYLGLIEMLLLAFFLTMAIQDALTGKVYCMMFVPVPLLLGWFHPITFLVIFAPLFAILLLLWGTIDVLQTRVRYMDSEKSYFGFGDVMGVPFAVTLAQILLPVLGLAAFATCMLVTLPWSLRMKNVRLLPWLVPGVILAFIAALVVS